MLRLMSLHFYSQIITLIFIISIQIYRTRVDKSSKVWACIKVAFNFQVFKIYLIVILYELKQIKDYLDLSVLTDEGLKDIFLKELENNLFYLSLFVYIGTLFLLLFLRILQQNTVKLKNLNKLRYVVVIKYSIKALIQTLMFQCFVSILVFYINNQIDKFIQMVYIRMLFFLSAVSSMDPILQILIQSPMAEFFRSYNAIAQGEIQPLDYHYVQLNKTEYCDSLREQDYSDNNYSLIILDQEAAQLSNNKSFDNNFKSKIYQSYRNIKRSIYYLLQVIYFLYCFVQMLTAFLVIVALMCIFIQTIYPNTDLLSYLNAADYFDLSQNDPQNIQMKEISTILTFLSKVIFVVIMYFSSQNRIQYKQRKDIINDVNNIVVIVRKSLLNFSLIGLLTTLYPNLTMTINNTDCFKNISFIKGEFVSHSQQNQPECPVTIMGLLTMKMVESQSVIILAQIMLVLYIIYSAYMVARVAVKRKS